MKTISKKEQESADYIIANNPKHFKELDQAHKDALLELAFLNKEIKATTFESIIALDQRSIVDILIELGECITHLRNAVKRKVIYEYIAQQKGYEIAVCNLCEQVSHFFYIKDRLTNVDTFQTQIATYKNGKLSSSEMREITIRIRSYQHNFNLNHLKKYSTILFGISYKELEAMKDYCNSQTFGNYSSMLISKEGTVYTNKDGSIAE